MPGPGRGRNAARGLAHRSGLRAAGHRGLLLVIGVEFGLILCCGVFNPVHATCRLQHTAADRVTRTLTAWTVTARATTALLTALWGVLGSLLGPRTAIALACLVLLATPLLLLRRAAATTETRPADGATV